MKQIRKPKVVSGQADNRVARKNKKKRPQPEQLSLTLTPRVIREAAGKGEL